MKPQLTFIAAMDESRLLATAHGIPWQLPRDIAHFRQYTANHWLLMGSTTYGQMRGWFQEGHHPLVLTRRVDWKLERGQAVATVEEALSLAGAAGQSALICCGGAQVYAAALPFADRMVLTRVQHRFPAEDNPVYFPEWIAEQWQVTRETAYAADPENALSVQIVEMSRRR